jgi:diguanylate cyclase (GGDEF)-like protein
MKRTANWGVGTDTKNILLMVALIVLLTFGGVNLSRIVSAHMLRSDALSTSSNWADSLVNNIDNLPAVFAGTVPSDRLLHSLNEATRVGDVYGYRLWDTSGRLVFASGRAQAAGAPAATLTGLLGKASADAVLSGTEITFAKTGGTGDNPAYYAISYASVSRHGRPLGVVEVYLDQTSDKALYEHSFLFTECIIAFGMLLAGGIPAAMVYRKTRDHRAAQAEAQFLAEHDPLTGLPNRAGLKERAEAALALAGRSQSHIAALLIDLDRFKNINDTYGHNAGDEVLQQLAQRLKNAVRSEDLAVRMGGDEFFVLQTGLTQPTGAASLARRLIKVLSEPYQVAGTELNCGACIGIAIGPADAKDWDSLISCADAAMYKAKEEGRNTFCFFQPGMDAMLRERRQIEADMRRALDTKVFQLAFQPLLNCSDRRLVGFEALLRWPEGWPSQTPDKFIPVAEECGLMVPLGAWVLETACRAAMEWKAPLKIAVNLSPMQFRHGDLVTAVEKALRLSGLPSERLELEVTESIWLQNTDSVLDQLVRLRSMGVSIALDDFGTGYSSLTYLWRFPFDKVKIDRSFVMEMELEPKAEAIVASVIALARTLRLTVTAEGVETLAQADALNGIGCDQAQGYFFGRPLPAAATNALIETAMSGSGEEIIATRSRQDAHSEIESIAQ